MVYQKGHHQYNTGRTRFKKGHVPWSKGMKYSDEEKIKIKNAVKKAMENPEVRKRISETIKRLYRDGKWISPFKGKHHTEESKIRNMIAHLGNNYALGAKRSEKTRKKIKETVKRLYKEGKLKPSSTCFKKGNRLSAVKRKPLTEEHKKKLSLIAKKLWENIEYKEMMLKLGRKAMVHKPNKSEKILINLFNNNNLPISYVGDGKVWFEGFNPDFICNTKKKIIEVYGDYWHNLPRYKVLDKKRIKSYSKCGFQTLVIWEHELKNLNQVIDKIRGFVEN